jgi:hypothetical protein
MLKGNLATRPFYNERLVSLLLVLAAAGIAALIYYNVTEFRRLSDRRAALTAEIERDRADAAAVRAETAKLRQTVDQAALRRLSADTLEANTLIDQRTFSWTTFFTVVQNTIPYDVRLTSVAPRVERGTILVRMGVLAKTNDELQEFIERLRATGTFPTAFASGTQVTDEGWLAAFVDSPYVPPGSSPKPLATGRGRGTP